MKALTVGSLVQVPLPALIVERSKSDGYDEKSTKAGKSRRRGKTLSGPNFTRALDWVSIAHGRRIHDLRHTAATNWLLNGIDINTVAAWLGHSDSAITLRIYTHYVPSRNDDAAVNQLDDAAATRAPVRDIGKELTAPTAGSLALRFRSAAALTYVGGKNRK